MISIATPTVSVIIPSFNKGAYISQTIQSVLNQTYIQWELIIVDDCSTDRSVELLKGFTETDNRIKLVSNIENKGGNYCRNLGIKMAKGEFLIFLDADDLLTPFCLSQRVCEMRKNDQLDFIVLSTGTFYKQIGDSNKFWIVPTRINHLHHFLQHRLPWNISAPFWKTEFVRNTGGFDETMNWLQDVEFHTRMLLIKDVRFKVINDLKPDFFYRIDPERLINSHFSYVRNYVHGQLQYINKMIVIIDKSDARFEMDRRYLKGSLASALRMVFYSTSLNRITIEQQDMLYGQIISDPSILMLTGWKDKFLIKLYKLIYKKKINRIKGIDKMFKYLVTL